MGGIGQTQRFNQSSCYFRRLAGYQVIRLSGYQAIRQLISKGINVNVTLLFGLPRYRQAAEAYIAGLEARTAQGKQVKQIASVASFFLSRIDALVDPLLKNIFEPEGRNPETAKKVH